MADNSNSIELEINNQLGIVGLEEDTPITQDSSTEVDETSRARGQMSQPRENDFQMLMDFTKQQFEKQDEKSDKQKEEINKKLDKQAVQFGQLKNELREHNEKWEKNLTNYKTKRRVQ